MKYLKRYQQHNEGLKSTLAGIGLAGSLLTTSPDVYSKPIEGTEQIQTLPTDGKQVYKMVDELSKIRNQKCEDVELNSILDEIKANLSNEDPEKLQEMFSKLSNHLQGNYGFKVGIQKVEDIQEEKVKEVENQPTELNLFSLLGWLGSVCLAICGVPQAIQSFKDKHSHGISWGFLLLWTFGEIFALAYVYDKLDLPLLVNYGSNILIVGIMLYYKIYPQTKSESP
jgi:uncharacterized protein with PQ loop repeat